MAPKGLLADGKGEGSATRALSPTPRKRLSPRKRGSNPRKRLNQLKRLLKRLDEVSAHASSEYVGWCVVLVLYTHASEAATLCTY